MSRPGVEVSSSASAPAAGVPTDTSVCFMVSEAAMGPVDRPTRVSSISEWQAVYGSRLAAAPLGYDSTDAYFHTGGGTLYFMRCHDGATAATGDASAVAAGGTATAAGPGAYGDGLTLEVVNTPGYTAQASADDEGRKSRNKKSNGNGPPQVAHLTYPDAQAAGGAFMASVKLGGNAVATSLPMDTVDDLANWLAGGTYMTLTGVTTGDPLTAGTVTLAGGTDGTLPVGSASGAVGTALDYIPKELGPGQIIAPGKTAGDDHGALLAHGSTHNRVALLDAPRGEDVQTLVSEAASLRPAQEARYGSLWAPWAVCPGVASGTTRVIPWSPIQAALCAANDLTGNPNQACAGQWGVPGWVLSLDQAFSAEDCELLLYAGVDTAREVYGTVQAYAFRTLVDPNTEAGEWLELNWARLNMAIVADCDAAGEGYVFAQLDGRGHTIAAFNGDCAGVLVGYYNVDALFGNDVTEAFVVNTGPSVNTPESMEDGRIRAVLSVRMSPHAELVDIEIVKTPITVSLV
jgi:hypothetical protein